MIVVFTQLCNTSTCYVFIMSQFNGLFKNEVSTPDYTIKWWTGTRIMNWKECGKKQQWPH